MLKITKTEKKLAKEFVKEIFMESVWQNEYSWKSGEITEKEAIKNVLVVMADAFKCINEGEDIAIVSSGGVTIIYIFNEMHIYSNLDERVINYGEE